MQPTLAVLSPEIGPLVLCGKCRGTVDKATCHTGPSTHAVVFVRVGEPGIATDGAAALRKVGVVAGALAHRPAQIAPSRIQLERVDGLP